MKFIALTGLALADASAYLAQRVQREGLQISIFIGLETAADAENFGHVSAEIWRIGADESRPELDFLIDRWIDGDTPEQLHAELDKALRAFLAKPRGTKTA